MWDNHEPIQRTPAHDCTGGEKNLFELKTFKARKGCNPDKTKARSFTPVLQMCETSANSG